MSLFSDSHYPRRIRIMYILSHCVYIVTLCIYCHMYILSHYVKNVTLLVLQEWGLYIFIILVCKRRHNFITPSWFVMHSVVLIISWICTGTTHPSSNLLSYLSKLGNLNVRHHPYMMILSFLHSLWCNPYACYYVTNCNNVSNSMLSNKILTQEKYTF